MKKVILMACSVSSLTAQLPLDVKVFDQAKTSQTALTEAQDVLRRIFRSSGIEVRWVLASPDAPEARVVVVTEPPPAARKRAVECAARRDIALSILPDSSARLKAGTLGYAEPLAPAGLNVTVYLARVSNAVKQHGVPMGVLLGHVMAHEIGHVLLRTASHRKHGLMSGGWDDDEFRWIRTAPMVFDAADIRRIKATLVGEGCESLAAETTTRRARRQ